MSKKVKDFGIEKSLKNLGIKAEIKVLLQEVNFLLPGKLLKVIRRQTED